MADKTDDPAKQNAFTRQQQLWLAVRGHEIAARMAGEENAPVEAVLGAAAAKALEHYARHQGPGPLSAEEYQRSVIAPLCAAFFAKTYPASSPAARRVPLMNWVTDRYLSDTHNEKQILAEDLYKIGELVQSFTGLRDGKHLPGGARHDLIRYESLAAVRDVVKPFEEKRRLKKAERQERRMNKEERARIMAESTVIYNGPAGKIVMPHTVFASQYWGNATKWCISGQKTAGQAFPGYNRDGPIVFLLPRAGEKMALVHKQYWDPRDDNHNIPSAEAGALWEEAVANTTDPPIRRALMALQPDSGAQAKETLSPLPPPFDPPLTADEQFWVDKLVKAAQQGVSPEGVLDDIYENYHIILAAVKQNGWALRYATPALRAAPEIVLAAVKQNGWALRYAAPALRAAPEIVLAAVKQDGRALQCAAPALQATPEIVLRALQENGAALRYADPVVLQADREVVLSAVKQNGMALEYAAPALQAAPEIVLAALRQNGEALRYVDSTLQADPAFGHYMLENGAPEFVLCIGRFSDAIRPPDKIILPDEETILRHQIRALETLLREGKGDSAARHLRHIKPLWGQGTRIFGDSAAQLSYLKTLISPAPAPYPAV